MSVQVNKPHPNFLEFASNVTWEYKYKTQNIRCSFTLWTADKDHPLFSVTKLGCNNNISIY